MKKFILVILLTFTLVAMIGCSTDDTKDKELIAITHIEVEREKTATKNISSHIVTVPTTVVPQTIGKIIVTIANDNSVQIQSIKIKDEDNNIMLYNGSSVVDDNGDDRASFTFNSSTPTQINLLFEAGDIVKANRQFEVTEVQYVDVTQTLPVVVLVTDIDVLYNVNFTQLEDIIEGTCNESWALIQGNLYNNQNQYFRSVNIVCSNSLGGKTIIALKNNISVNNFTINGNVHNDISSEMKGVQSNSSYLLLSPLISIDNPIYTSESIIILENINIKYEGIDYNIPLSFSIAIIPNTVADPL